MEHREKSNSHGFWHEITLPVAILEVGVGLHRLVTATRTPIQVQRATGSPRCDKEWRRGQIHRKENRCHLQQVSNHWGNPSINNEVPTTAIQTAQGVPSERNHQIAARGENEPERGDKGMAGHHEALRKGSSTVGGHRLLILQKQTGNQSQHPQPYLASPQRVPPEQETHLPSTRLPLRWWTHRNDGWQWGDGSEVGGVFFMTF